LNEECPLCNLEKLTTWYEETDTYILCDCLTCNVPMVVLVRHSKEPTTEERRVALNALIKLANKKYGDGQWYPRGMRQIPDHWHLHAVPGDPIENLLVV